MSKRFIDSDEVYNFMNNPNDAWIYPMVESYIDQAGLDLDEEFDVTELNEWLEDELSIIQDGFNKRIKI